MQQRRQCRGPSTWISPGFRLLGFLVDGPLRQGEFPAKVFVDDPQSGADAHSLDEIHGPKFTLGGDQISLQSQTVVFTGSIPLFIEFHQQQQVGCEWSEGGLDCMVDFPVGVERTVAGHGFPGDAGSPAIRAGGGRWISLEQTVATSLQM